MHPLECDFLGVGVEAGQLHELLDEVPQAGDIVHQQLGRATRLGRHLIEVLARRSRPPRPAP